MSSFWHGLFHHFSFFVLVKHISLAGSVVHCCGWLRPVAEHVPSSFKRGLFSINTFVSRRVCQLFSFHWRIGLILLADIHEWVRLYCAFKSSNFRSFWFFRCYNWGQTLFLIEVFWSFRLGLFSLKSIRVKLNFVQIYFVNHFHIGWKFCC